MFGESQMTEQSTDVINLFGEDYKIEDLKPEAHRQITKLQDLRARLDATANQIGSLQEDAYDIQVVIAAREALLRESIQVVEEEKEVVQ
tara:strand:- start:7250 stop:7516 length:267 start_codon:yes stop_codon:yes gene_type:complete